MEEKDEVVRVWRRVVQLDEGDSEVELDISSQGNVVQDLINHLIEKMTSIRVNARKFWLYLAKKYDVDGDCTARVTRDKNGTYIEVEVILGSEEDMRLQERGKEE